MRPLIGITMNLEVQEARDLNILDLDYGRAVYRAGGMPVPILGMEEALPDIVNRLQGFLFTGGDDIHPRFYGERPLKSANMRLSPDARTRFEIKLFLGAVKKKRPVLAVCHGMQLVNVALGGSLFQDIPLQFKDHVRHAAEKKGEKVFHRVAVLEGTRLSWIFGSSFVRVRSAHHQAVKNPGRGLKLSGLASDGVIEALEGRDKGFLIAVQWHPEKTPDDKNTKRLFKALVDAARG